MGKAANDLGTVYSKAKTTVEVARALGEAVGLLQKRQSAEEGIAEIQKRLEFVIQQVELLGVRLDGRESARDRANRLGMALRAVVTAQQAIASGQNFNPAWPAAENSGLAATQVMMPVQFESIYSHQSVAGEWDKMVSRRAASPGGIAYDWRLGVPAMLQIIAARISVIAALDASFKTSGIYRNELLDYRANILSHIQRMNSGIECGWAPGPANTNTIRVGCADIHSGLASYQTFENPANFWLCLDLRTGRFNEDCYRQEHAKWLAFHQNEVATSKILLRAEVAKSMPIFEMQSLADQLYSYAFNSPELTTRNRRIQSNSNPNLCIDVQWGNPGRGTPVWLWPCDGNNAQQWVYDRRSGLIRNPAYDKCLDVQWGRITPGAPIWTWDCTGDPAQTWTWDPETGQLQNALGTVAAFNQPTQADLLFTENRYTPVGPKQQWIEMFTDSDSSAPPKISGLKF